MKTRYTIEIPSADAKPIISATFKCPIAWDCNAKPTHWKHIKLPVATCVVHKTDNGFKHILRVCSMRIPPLQQ